MLKNFITKKKTKNLLTTENKKNNKNRMKNIESDLQTKFSFGYNK